MLQGRGHGISLRCLGTAIVITIVLIGPDAAQTTLIEGDQSRIVINRTLVITDDGQVGYKDRDFRQWVSELSNRVGNEDDGAQAISAIWATIPLLMDVADPAQFPVVAPGIRAVAQKTVDATIESVISALDAIIADPSREFDLRDDAADALDAILRHAYWPGPKELGARLKKLRLEAHSALTAFQPVRQQHEAEQQERARARQQELLQVRNATLALLDSNDVSRRREAADEILDDIYLEKGMFKDLRTSPEILQKVAYALLPDLIKQLTGDSDYAVESACGKLALLGRFASPALAKLSEVAHGRREKNVRKTAARAIKAITKN